MSPKARPLLLAAALAALLAVAGAQAGGKDAPKPPPAPKITLSEAMRSGVVLHASRSSDSGKSSDDDKSSSRGKSSDSDRHSYARWDSDDKHGGSKPKEDLPGWHNKPGDDPPCGLTVAGKHRNCGRHDRPMSKR